VAGSIKMPEALEDGRIPGRIRAALREWWEWYDLRYAMPVEIDVEPNVIRIIISYNAEQEIEECTRACVERHGEELKEELKAEGATEEEIEEKIRHGCFDDCKDDIVSDVNTSFNEVFYELDKVLRRYGIRYEDMWGWDGYEKWVSIKIEL